MKNSNDMKEEIDNILEGLHKGEYDLITVKSKLLILFGISGSLPVYATTFDDKGELEHQRLSVEYAGKIITKLSEKVNAFEDFIDSFNENYR